jgi:hypothetical protein
MMSAVVIPLFRLVDCDPDPLTILPPPKAPPALLSANDLMRLLNCVRD